MTHFKKVRGAVVIFVKKDVIFRHFRQKLKNLAQPIADRVAQNLEINYEIF